MMVHSVVLPSLQCSLHDIAVKRSSMVDDSVLLQTAAEKIIIPTFGGDAPLKPDKQDPVIPTADQSWVDEFTDHVTFQRSFSESSKDRRPLLDQGVLYRDRCGSVSDTRFLNNLSSRGVNVGKRTVRIAEETSDKIARPGSLEVEHVTVGEVTPTLYVKDKNSVVDSSYQQSESVLKRSLSVSNSRLQRKLSKKLQGTGSSCKRAAGPTDHDAVLRRNRCPSLDKSSPPPDLQLMSQAGIHMEDIQAFGFMYVQKLENRMRNIDALKEIEKQHNISCRERLKTALDTHEQLAAGLEEVKKQLKECMEKYRFISETFV